jgi:phage FluMu protein Com
MELQTVKCVHCGKTLLEASGEVKKICPKCGQVTHVVVTSKGIIDLNHVTM